MSERLGIQLLEKMDGLSACAMVHAAIEILSADPAYLAEELEPGMREDIDEAKVRLQALIHTAPSEGGDSNASQICVGAIWTARQSMLENE